MFSRFIAMQLESGRLITREDVDERVLTAVQAVAAQNKLEVTKAAEERESHRIRQELEQVAKDKEFSKMRFQLEKLHLEETLRASKYNNKPNLAGRVRRFVRCHDSFPECDDSFVEYSFNDLLSAKQSEKLRIALATEFDLCLATFPLPSNIHNASKIWRMFTQNDKKVSVKAYPKLATVLANSLRRWEERYESENQSLPEVLVKGKPEDQMSHVPTQSYFYRFYRGVTAQLCWSRNSAGLLQFSQTSHIVPEIQLNLMFHVYANSVDQTQFLDPMRYQEMSAEELDREGWIREFSTDNLRVGPTERDGTTDWSCDSIKVFWDLKVILLVEFKNCWCGSDAIEQVSLTDGRYPSSLVSRTDGKFVGFRVVPVVAIINVPSAYDANHSVKHRNLVRQCVLHRCHLLWWQPLEEDDVKQYFAWLYSLVVLPVTDGPVISAVRA
jgi:hypothetical protein